jgi:hypothetical protein
LKNRKKKFQKEDLDKKLKKTKKKLVGAYLAGELLVATQCLRSSGVAVAP